MSVVRNVPWTRVSRYVTVGALATALVACSSGSTAKSGSSGGGGTSVLTGDPVAVVAGTPGKTVAAKNADISLDGKIASGAQDVPLTGTGAIDFANKTFQLNLTLPGMGTIEELVLGQIIYIKVPTQAAGEFGGKPWLKLDPSQFGAGKNPFGSLDSSNPSQVLNTLQGAGQVTKVGDDTVRGVHTVHYKAMVDIAKAADAQKLTPQQKQQLQAALGGQTTVPEDVWIDDQGLARRVATDITATPSTGTGTTSSVKAQLTVEFFDYGKANVTATPPPADQVTDFGQVLGQLGQLGSAFGSGSGTRS
jgi:hypothetical protein